MANKVSRKSYKSIWLLCALCALIACILAIHAMLIWNQAQVIVEWETASELNTVGFNLLRSESPDGPFTQVNTELIPSASDTLTGNQYSYEDTDTEAGNTYFYMLEEIELTGKTSQHGPIEVKAQNFASGELTVAILLLLGAATYVVLTIRELRQKSKI